MPEYLLVGPDSVLRIGRDVVDMLTQPVPLPEGMQIYLGQYDAIPADHITDCTIRELMFGPRILEVPLENTAEFLVPILPEECQQVHLWLDREALYLEYPTETVRYALKDLKIVCTADYEPDEPVEPMLVFAHQEKDGRDSRYYHIAVPVSGIRQVARAIGEHLHIGRQWRMAIPCLVTEQSRLLANGYGVKVRARLPDPPRPEIIRTSPKRFAEQPYKGSVWVMVDPGRMPARNLGPLPTSIWRSVSSVRVQCRGDKGHSLDIQSIVLASLFERALNELGDTDADTD